MRDDKLTQQIFDQQLVSIMNRTKWRELAQALVSNKNFIPTVRLNYLDGYETAEFSHLDWEWVKYGDARIIKWLEIDSVRRNYIGRLARQQETDFSAWVRGVLTECFIPFSEKDGIFHIDAYLQSAKA